MPTTARLLLPTLLTLAVACGGAETDLELAEEAALADVSGDSGSLDEPSFDEPILPLEAAGHETAAERERKRAQREAAEKAAAEKAAAEKAAEKQTTVGDGPCTYRITGFEGPETCRTYTLYQGPVCEEQPLDSVDVTLPDGTSCRFTLSWTGTGTL